MRCWWTKGPTVPRGTQISGASQAHVTVMLHTNVTFGSGSPVHLDKADNDSNECQKKTYLRPTAA
jgi:hypothetical protein